MAAYSDEADDDVMWSMTPAELLGEREVNVAGVTEDESPHLEALEACAELIARAERR
jgi:hypothetical protein